MFVSVAKLGQGRLMHQISVVVVVVVGGGGGCDSQVHICMGSEVSSGIFLKIGCENSWRES